MPTTIQLTEETRDKLASLKRHPRETYDEIVGRLVEQELEDSLVLAAAMKKRLAKARKSAKAGRLLTTDELVEQLGL